MNAENSCIATATAIPNCATGNHTTLACATCNSGYYPSGSACNQCSDISGCTTCSQIRAICLSCGPLHLRSRNVCCVIHTRYVTSTLINCTRYYQSNSGCWTAQCQCSHTGHNPYIGGCVTESEASRWMVKAYLSRCGGRRSEIDCPF